jgi:hypothetical protein
MMSDEFQKSTTGPTLPRKGHTIRAPVKSPLPCLVILVHGVNDVGEAYEAQEKGLCWGLAERLSRNYDLKPFAYQLPSEKRDDPLVPEPDKVYYQRIKTPDAYSPIVPFHWGFREEDGLIKKKAWHGEWLDRYDNRIDKNGAKNGGAFVNSVNCLPHMWADGWSPSGPTKVANGIAGTPTHDLKRAPYRSYQVLAALRLAMLIRIIRKRHPKVAINVVAHSMGCCVSLLAQAFLMDEGQKPADALVLNNTTYSFEENHLDNGQFGKLNQTTFARIETLKNLVKAFHDQAATSPTLEELKAGSDETGFAGEPWGPGRAQKLGQDSKVNQFMERDNRGHIHLYFSPEDRTVALFNTQGIGWQGVPDSYTSESKPHHTWHTLMDDLHASGFRQRIFFKQSRGGQRFKVGLPCQHVSIRERADTNGSMWGTVKRVFALRKSPDVGTMRRINGAELNPSIEFIPGPEKLPISPIDAAIALAHGADRTMEREFNDPRPYDEWPFPLNHTGDDPRLRALFNRGKSSEDQIVSILEVKTLGTGRLWVRYQATPDGIRKHQQSLELDDNSYHSAIVSNHWHSQMVTAYDLALGEPIFWSDKEQKFYNYICEVADWRIKSTGIPKSEHKLENLLETGFYEHESDKNKDLITATAKYYCKGKLPPQIQSLKTANHLSNISFETIDIRG